MDAIEIPIRIVGVSRAQSQINNIGRQLATLPQGARVPSASGGNAAVAASQRAGRPPRPTPSLGQQVASAIGSSRVSFQNGRMQLNPLVNRIVPIFMRLSPVLSVATLAIGAMASAAASAAASIAAFRDSQITTGGTGAQTAMLRSMGIDPGLARSFGQRIASDPMAAGFAARAGVYNPGGETFGDTNTATNLLKMAESLRRMSERDALRTARITGTEDLLKFRGASEGTMNQLRQDAGQTDKIMNPDQVKIATEYQLQMVRLNSAFSDLATSLGQYVIPIISAGAEFLADSVRGLNMMLNSPIVKWFIENLTPVGQIGKGAKAFSDANKPRGLGKDAQVSALDANTASLRELAGILKDGIYGGGERARGAVPAGWKAQYYNEWSRNAVGLGAFSL